MDEVIKVRSTSRNSAIADDAILRETETTRLIFRPQIVDNPNDKNACINGCFIFQRKNKSASWEDCKGLSLNKLKSGDGIKLALHSKEILILINKIQELQTLYKEHGIVYGKNEFRVTRGNVANVLNQISQLENKEIILQALERFSMPDLQNLNYVAGISRFKAAIDFWNKNKGNDREEFWQAFLKENSWVISQVFSYPAVLFQDKAYVGGKYIDNKGGNIVDFIYQKQLTKNIALVEIKTPMTKLVNVVYRKTSESAIYSISGELTGAINQVLVYRETLQKNFYTLTRNREVELFNPECIIIIGSLEKEKLNNDQKKSLELFRGNNKDVEIITFDELFLKIKVLLDLLERK